MTLLGLVAAAVLSSPMEKVQLAPTDDVWVYAHAAAQDEDPYMRIWGSGDYAVGKPGPGAFDFSYSLVRFSLPDGKGAPKKAILTVYQTADPAYTEEDFKAAPLEARLAPEDWNENTWTYDKSEKIVPDAKDEAILGKAEREAILQGKPIKMTIDLLKGPGKITWGRTLSLALTTKMDPESMGEGRTYKVYSRNSEDKDLQPSLELEY